MIATARAVEDMHYMIEYETDSRTKKNILPFPLSERHIEDLIFAFKKTPEQEAKSRNIINLIKELPYHVPAKYIQEVLSEANGEYCGDRATFFGREELLIIEKANGSLVWTGGRDEFDVRFEEEQAHPELSKALLLYQTKL